ncbi:MAG: hypothetical protein LH614_05920 [Pyrinomonadaceae bacterium]|nr:hypothetical protein [Pyrinomonadaceae bacterium]
MQKIIGSIFLLILLVFSANAQNSRKIKAPKPVKPTVIQPEKLAVNQKDCVPKITSQVIRPFLRGKVLKEISTTLVATGGTTATEWTFDTKEILEIDVVETTFLGNQTIVVAQIKTGDAPGAQTTIYDEDDNVVANPVLTIEGRIRLTLENIANQQTLIKLENLTVKGTHTEPTIRNFKQN